jgi:hypothetical protein
LAREAAAWDAVPRFEGSDRAFFALAAAPTADLECSWRGGLTVIEVDRPDRSGLRRNRQSDPLDAESVARAVQSGRASGTPKSRDAQAEMIRVLRVARRGAMKVRIQTGAQIDAIIVSAPEPVRAPRRQAESPAAHPRLRRPEARPAD